MTEIIILFVVALVIILRLRSEFGKTSEEEKTDIQNKIRQMQEDAKNQSQSCNNGFNNQNLWNKKPDSSNQNQDEIKIIGSSSTDNDNPILNNLSYTQKNQLLKALESLEMSVDFFTNGLKKAFTIIIESFANGNEKDLQNLEFLSSKDIYQNFYNSIKNRQNNGKKLNTQIIEIKDIKIIAVTQISTIITISAEFTSLQINYITNDNLEITEGSNNEIIELIDKWSFAKDLSNSQENWKLVATN